MNRSMALDARHTLNAAVAVTRKFSEYAAPTELEIRGIWCSTMMPRLRRLKSRQPGWKILRSLHLKPGRTLPPVRTSSKSVSDSMLSAV